MFRITRKRLAGISSALTLTLVLVLILATTASAGGKGRVVHRVSVGGPDLCDSFGLPPGCDASFSLSARLYADGSVKGQYTDQFGDGTGGFHAVIDCLSVDGNQAWVSGVITQGAEVGRDVSTRVRDNGTSAKDLADQISFSFIGAGLTCTDTPDYPLFDVPQGQVKVD
jgi:hypothetical protein